MIEKRIKGEDDCLNNLVKDLEAFTLTSSVLSLDLLHALVAVQLNSVEHVNTRIWLDRLIQRYEVTKKLYELYPAGFRKGEGGNTSVRLYWLFALALCLFYVKTNEIKYLSTLLKLCDLLCSLPKKVLQGNVPENGLSIVLVAEVVSIQLLAKTKEGALAPK